MSNSPSTFVLVSGAMRSGTTLLGELLGPRSQDHQPHPDLIFANDLSPALRRISKTLSESHLPSSDALQLAANLQLDEINLDSAKLQSDLGISLDLEEGSGSEILRALLLTDMESTCNRPISTPFAGLKQTNMTWEWSVLAQCFPEAKTLIMIRDPRDAFASHLNRVESLVSLSEARLHWISLLAYMELASNPALQDPAIRFIRYEDLVERPEKTMREVLDFLGLAEEPYDWEAIRSNRISSNSSYNKYRGHKQSENAGINSDSFGAHKYRLSPAEIHTMDVLFAPYLEFCGYETGGIHVSNQELEAIIGRLFELQHQHHSRYAYSAEPIRARALKNFSLMEVAELESHKSSEPDSADDTTRVTDLQQRVRTLTDRLRDSNESNSLHLQAKLELSGRIQELQQKLRASQALAVEHRETKAGLRASREKLYKLTTKNKKLAEKVSQMQERLEKMHARNQRMQEKLQKTTHKQERQPK